jgi:GMP synthase-like glutamine amidotransferase
MSGGGGSSCQLRALVIQHELSTPGGYVNEWLEARGAEQDVLHIYADEREVHVRDYDLVVTLGSDLASFDDTIPWLAREQRLLVEAEQGDVALLGICFGCQLLARALGGRSFRGEHSEIGWLSIQSSDRSLIPEGPWFQWHSDTFMPPPHARVIADSAAGPQAYIAGRTLGLQFHPEVTPAIVDGWVASSRAELELEGVDPDALSEQTQRLADESRAAAWRLFDGFLNRVSDVPEAIGGR